MRLTPKPLLATAVITLSAVICVSAQDSRPKFQVASIKRNTSGRLGNGPINLAGSRFAATNVPLKTLLFFAYRTANQPFLDNQIVGAPGWSEVDRFDIEAKAGETSVIPQDQVQLMLQSLLEDRFQLKAHKEMREVPTYDLLVIRGGKLKPLEDQTPPTRSPLPAPPPDATSQISVPRGRIIEVQRPSGSVMSGRSVPIGSLVNMLQGITNRLVFDKTNLKGLFDIELHYLNEGFVSGPTVSEPQAAPSDPLPSIFTALQEQLGLKLESTRGPVEVLVIENVSKPSEN